MFERIKPGERDLLVAAYRGDEIVGFLGNVPQKFQFGGRIYPATYSCLLVIRRDVLRQGLASSLIGEGLRINDRYRCAFSLFGLETGHRSTKMIEKFVREGRGGSNGSRSSASSHAFSTWAGSPRRKA
jgi:hypothetical protein